MVDFDDLMAKHVYRAAGKEKSENFVSMIRIGVRGVKVIEGHEEITGSGTHLALLVETGEKDETQWFLLSPDAVDMIMEAMFSGEIFEVRDKDGEDEETGKG